MNVKYCTKCKTEKPVSEFFKNKSIPDGFHAHCKACKSEYDKKYRDRDDRKAWEHHRADTRRFSDWRTKFWSAKTNAIKRGLEFSIDIEDVPIPEYCPLLEIPLIMGETNRWNKPSIDRIDSSMGYVKGNVWVISVLANTMKAHASKDELIKFSKNAIKIFDN